MSDFTERKTKTAAESTAAASADMNNGRKLAVRETTNAVREKRGNGECAAPDKSSAASSGKREADITGPRTSASSPPIKPGQRSKALREEMR
jgi:hypothetical protein